MKTNKKDVYSTNDLLVSQTPGTVAQQLWWFQAAKVCPKKLWLFTCSIIKCMIFILPVPPSIHAAVTEYTYNW